MHFDGREKLPQLFKNRLVGKRSLEIGMTVDDKNFFSSENPMVAFL